MAAQDIYITPKQILSYLKDFEEKLPTPQKDYYKSTLRSAPLTIEALNNEVNNMANYIGMSGFTANCKWAKLPPGVGGQIKLDSSRCGLLDIEVNEEYKNEIEVTAATLAHELCHKFLQLHGLYFPKFTEINETYTDLCTIYVGFGEVIIKGYSTEKWKSGYLQFPIYKRTNNLVRMIIWGEPNNAISEQTEPYLEEALKVWVSTNEKRQLSRREYKNTYNEFSDYQRSIEIFRQLLFMLEEEPLKLADEIDGKMYNPEWFNEDGSLKKKVKCFEGIYEGIIIRERYNDTPIKKVNKFLKQVIALMVDTIGRNRFTENRINRLYFECPYCKHRALTSKIANSHTIVKCPNCKKRFAVNCEEFDLLSARNDLDAFKTELMIPIRREFEKSKEKDRSDAFMRGMRHGKELKAKELDPTIKKYEGLKQKIEKLPKWLKWLIGDRLK